MNRINKYLKSKKYIAITFTFVAIYLIGCEKYTIESVPVNPTDPRSFKTDILPIFAKNGCAAASCHGGPVKPDLRPANAYTSLTNGKMYSVSTPESSKLYTQLLNSSTHQARTNETEEAKILYWITQGAKNN
jgi:hypothetical protein